MSDQLTVGQEGGALVPPRRFTEVLVQPGPEGLIGRLKWIIAPPTPTQRMALFATQAKESLGQAHIGARRILDEVQTSGRQVGVNLNRSARLQEIGACVQALIMLEDQTGKRASELEQQLAGLVRSSGITVVESFMVGQNRIDVQMREPLLEVAVTGIAKIDQVVTDLKQGIETGTADFSEIMTWITDAGCQLRARHQEMLRLDVAIPILRIFQHTERMREQGEKAKSVISDIQAQREALCLDPKLRPNESAIRAGIESSARTMLEMPEEEGK